MAEKKFSEAERQQHIQSIEEQVKYLEEAERELKTKMSKDEEKALKEEAKTLQKPPKFHRSLSNKSASCSDEISKREAHSLRAQKGRAELLKCKGVQLAGSEYNRGEIRVVLNGKTGKGKSALGNNLLGKKHFKSEASFKGITNKCAFGVRNLDEEYKLLVVDTPGLFDSDTPNKEMSKEITKCIGLVAPGPNIFIFVISAERFSPEEKETLTNLQKLFGEKVIDHVIIVITRKDNIKDNGIMEFMKDADDILLDLLVKCKFRFAFIDNKADPDDVRVDIDVILDLIFKTIGDNNGAYYTNKEFGIVNDAVGTTITEKEKEKEREIQQLKKEKQKLRDRTSFSRKELESRITELETRKELEKRIKELEKKNVYYETKQEIEKADKNGTFGQKLKKALGIGVGITAGAAAGAAFVAGSPVVGAGAGVAAAASWLSSWL